MALRGLQLEKPMRTWNVSAPACVRATKANEPLLLVQLEDIHDVLNIPWNGMSQLLAKRESQVFEVHVAVLIHHIPASHVPRPRRILEMHVRERWYSSLILLTEGS